jgi:hypothetical protein
MLPFLSESQFQFSHALVHDYMQSKDQKVVIVQLCYDILFEILSLTRDISYAEKLFDTWTDQLCKFWDFKDLAIDSIKTTLTWASQYSPIFKFFNEKDVVKMLIGKLCDSEAYVRATSLKCLSVLIDF